MSPASASPLRSGAFVAFRHLGDAPVELGHKEGDRIARPLTHSPPPALGQPKTQVGVERLGAAARVGPGQEPALD
jgi:hypothetical protein